MTIKVHKYGLLPPTEGSDAAEDQLRHAHKYRNKLIELERERRRKLREIIDGSAEKERAKVQQAEEACLKAREDLAKSSAQNRSRNKADPELKKAYQDAKKQQRKAYKALEKARRQAWKTHKEKVREIDQQHEDIDKEARAETPTYWGTYQLVEVAMKASKKDKDLWDWRWDWHSSANKPLDPDFRRWKGQGQLSVQVQRDPRDKNVGLAAENVFDSNNLVWIDPVDERAWYDPVRGVRRRLSRTRLHLRIGSGEKKRPIWAIFPMIMHRPLPEKGRVKRVTVNKRRIGTRTEWTADFVIDVSNVRPEEHPVQGTVAIDLGWRQLEEGPIRVAAWDASDGETGCLELSPELISSLRYDRELRSIRKKNFKRILRKLVAHFRKNTMPAWMRREMSQTGDTPTPAKARATLAQWESAGRLARLAKKWKENKVSPKRQNKYKKLEKCCHDFPLLYSWEQESVYKKLEKWCYHDFHLYSWEQDQRTKSRRRRKDLYRNFAAQLSRKYKALIIEDFDLSEVNRNSDVDEKADIHGAKANQHLASVHELRDCLVNAFSRCGETIEVDPKDSTRTCYECGVVNTWDQAAELVHRCEGCGEVWDQDYNAARILRSRGEREQCSGANNSGTARDGKNNGKSKKKAKSKRPSLSFRELHKRRRTEASRNEVQK